MIDEAGRKLILERNGLRASRVFATPGEIAQEAQKTDALVESVNNAISGKKVPGPWLIAWNNFYGRWKGFYSQVSSAGSVILTRIKNVDIFTNTAADQLNQFETELAAFAEQAKKLHAKIPGSTSLPGTGTNPLVYVGIAAIALVGIVVAVKIVKTVSLGNALEEAEEDALEAMDRQRSKRHDKSAFSIS